MNLKSSFNKCFAWTRIFSHLFGIGYLTSFPGTLASLFASFFILLSLIFLDQTTYFYLFILSTLIAFLSIHFVQEKKEQKDSSWIVIDEWLGMWIAGFFLFETNFSLNEALIYLGIAFVLFRFFDISKKIPPINIINKNDKQSANNIILDDVVAGVYTYLLMLGILHFFKEDFSLNLLFFGKILLILLPAMTANMIPVLLKFSFLNSPINQKMFGQNKTWRGFLGAIFAGILTTFILAKIGWFNQETILKDTYQIWDNIFILKIGFLLGFGAIFGDLIKSFFKRRVKIPSGENFIPWDQIDFVLGAIIFTYPIFQYDTKEIFFMLFIGASISALAHRFAYLVKLINTKQ